MKDDPISKFFFKTLGFKKSDEQCIWTEKNQNLKLTQTTNEPRIKRKQTDQIQKIYCTMNSPKLQMNPESKLLLPRVTCTIKAQMILGLESQAKRIALCRIFVGLDGSEWVLGVRVSFDPFWDVFFTYLVLE